MINVKVVHLDELSQITDATFEKRKKFIPKAEAIIEEVKSESVSYTHLTLPTNVAV